MGKYVTPIEFLSPCSKKTLNPIMSHSKEIWIKVCRMYTLPQCKKLNSFFVALFGHEYM